MACPKRLAFFVCGALVLSLATVSVAQTYIYPSRGQSPQQQEFDRGQCYSWAESVERTNGKIIMQGAQAERGWTLVVSEDTGKMSETISADGEGFVIFGVCTLMP